MTPFGFDGIIRGRYRAGSSVSALRHVVRFPCYVDGNQPRDLFVPAGGQKAIQPLHYPDADGLVMISSGGYSGTQFPTIDLGDYQSWKTSTRHLFTGVAFYQPILKRVHIAKHRSAELSVGRASDNLFKLLNLPISAKGGDLERPIRRETVFEPGDLAGAFSPDDPRIIGSIAEIAGRRVLIAGVVSHDSWRLPGRVDASLFEDEHHLAMLPLRSRGFVLAHLRTGSLPQWADGNT